MSKKFIRHERSYECLELSVEKTGLKPKGKKGRMPLLKKLAQKLGQIGYPNWLSEWVSPRK